MKLGSSNWIKATGTLYKGLPKFGDTPEEYTSVMRDNGLAPATRLAG
jgi:hypothetical protein